MIGYYLHTHRPDAVDRARGIVESLPAGTTVISPHAAPLGWTAPWTRLTDDCGATFGAWLECHDVDAVVVDGRAEHALAAAEQGCRVAVVAPPGGSPGGDVEAAFSGADLILAPWADGGSDTAWPQVWQKRTLHLGAIGWSASRAISHRLPVAVRPAHGRWRCLHLAPSTAGPGPRERRDMLAETPGWQWWFAVERELLQDGPVWDTLLRSDVLVCSATPANLAAAAAAAVPTVLVVPERPGPAQAFLAGVAARTAPVLVADRRTPVHDWRSLLDRARTLDGRGWDRWCPQPGLKSLALKLEAPTRTRAGAQPATA